jgi:hypothetical protein
LHIHNRLESQLFHEELPAPLLIPNPERDKVQPKKRLQEGRAECCCVVTKHFSGMR